jgi:hypothetical protein
VIILDALAPTGFVVLFARKEGGSCNGVFDASRSCIPAQDRELHKTDNQFEPLSTALPLGRPLGVPPLTAEILMAIRCIMHIQHRRREIGGQDAIGLAFTSAGHMQTCFCGRVKPTNSAQRDHRVSPCRDWYHRGSTRQMTIHSLVTPPQSPLVLHLESVMFFQTLTLFFLHWSLYHF